MKLRKILTLILLVGFLAGCAIYDHPFFVNYSAAQLVIGAITILITISQALFPKISFMQYLKGWLPWLKDELAYYLVRAALFGLSALALWVTGEFDPTVKLTLEQVVIYYGILATISEGAYQRLKNSGRSLLPA